MRRLEYQRLKDKLTKLVAEFAELYKTHGEIEVEQTWKIDDCNSVTYKGPFFPYYGDDNDNSFYSEFLTCNFSPVFKDNIDVDHVTDWDQYEEHIVKPIVNKNKELIKKFNNIAKKLDKVLDGIYSYGGDYVYNRFYDKMSADDIVEHLLETILIEDEIYYSTQHPKNKKVWVEYNDLEEFIMNEGLVHGDEFWINKNNKVEKYTVECKETYKVEFFAKKD